MRLNLRRVAAVGSVFALIGVVAPVGAAYSQDNADDCRDLLGADTPAFVQCTWMHRPEEALGTALFWLADDGANMKESTPYPGLFSNCSDPGVSCPEDPGGDGTVGDDGSPAPEGAEDGGTPECEAGQRCSVDGHDQGGESGSPVPDDGSFTGPGSTANRSSTVTQPSVATGTRPPTAQEVAAAAQTPAGQAVTAARATGLRVWIDTELADDWKAGPAAFAAAVKRIGALAARPEVAGIRFTAQLGYNTTFTTQEEITAFVAGASGALRQAAPGKQLGVHTVVPEFACGAEEACKAEMAKRYPLLAPEKIELYLAGGGVDQISLDSGLFRGGYETWKIDAEAAQRNQWIQVRARAWDVLAQIAAEETGLVGDVATDEVAAGVSAPVMDGGAQQVNLWTRVQDAQGGVKHLTAWDALKKLGPIQRRMAAVYNPATPETDTAADLKKFAEVFGHVYLTTA
ncbi:hypothetical protein [Planobispora longispora]|uniref:Uncharacterized protein n=1 Tax=Planobispora longispora TaxID=28887 RepID=A0A8J3RQN8_9ACTN|nr:hypothetical protein [Planobispora longispora]BFE83923.1 hypothetical protein GCM10020093_065240 [Planobispora longispora]GIH78426.1 hypothetical protein Plo01_48550 [Planobispora longispora]